MATDGGVSPRWVMHRAGGGSAASPLNECPEFASTDADGVTTQFTTAPLSFPNLGERTLALRLHGSTTEFDLVVDVIMIAIGSNGISLVAGGLTPVRGAEMEEIATAAVEKLNEAAG